jgi:hypothetical protein
MRDRPALLDRLGEAGGPPAGPLIVGRTAEEAGPGRAGLLACVA